MTEFTDRVVLVTGSEGFIGRHLVSRLRHMGARVRGVSQKSRDLMDARDVAQVVDQENPPDYVFHLAGYNGGIAFNAKNPAVIFYVNTVMGLNLLDALTAERPTKVVMAVTSCAYNTPDGNCEEGDYLTGRPDDSVACHGYAKRNLQLGCHFYRQQYRLPAVCVCPPTVYGPGDSFDPERTKIMGAMIRRMVEARRARLPYVTVWGTGNPLREFIYVDDAVDLMLRAALHYEDSSRPLNIGTGQEVSVSGLAMLVAYAAGFRGDIRFDPSHPDGQYRKRLDLTRMRAILGDHTPVSLAEGVRRTIRFYEEIHPCLRTK